MSFEFDPPSGETPIVHDPSRLQVLDGGELLTKLASEVSLLQSALAQVEHAMCDIIDEVGIPIVGTVAASLQQLDLAVQTTSCLTDIMRTASQTTCDHVHDLDGLLAKVPLKDVADRIRKDDQAKL